MKHNQNNHSLFKALIISVLVAVITLVLFILPAEYNIDPTGVGQKLGITVFNQTSNSTKQQLNPQDEQHTVSLIVPAGRGIEYKLAMNQFEKVSYQWITNNDSVYVDLHGEPEGDQTGYFESYSIATVNDMKGSFTAPFKGSHGWYWKNKSDQDITIQLTFNGDYVIEGLK